MKAVLKQVVPPLAWDAVRKTQAWLSPPKPPLLFEGDDAAFRAAAATAKSYGEYGCGMSTRWMAANTRATIYAVDTAQRWIDTVIAEVGERDRVSLHWVDVGPLKSWGRPIGYSKSTAFQEYTDWIWQQEHRPDLVLVDGRFRVCCFATSLKHAAEGATIIFDDYTNRPHYHVVEQLLQLGSTCGRQALFKVPAKNTIDVAAVDRMIGNFRFVID